MFGIHSGSMEKILDRLEDSGLRDIHIQVFDDAYMCFPNENEFAKYLSGCHGNPDYTQEENRKAFDEILNEHTIDGEIKMKEWRFIWKARK